LPALRARFTEARFVALLPEEGFDAAEDAVDLVAHSFEEAALHAAAHYPGSGGRTGSSTPR
jgi:hypothetical protein